MCSSGLAESQVLLSVRAGAPQRGSGISCGIKLHGDDARVPQASQCAVQIAEVHLTSTGFVSAGHIRHMNQPNLIDVVFELFNQIPLTSLLMIEVVQDLQVWIGDSPREGESLGNAVKVDRGVLQTIDRLDDTDEPLSLQQLRRAMKRVKGGLMLPAGL